MDLTTCRQIGMSAGPIPWTAVQQYAETDRLDDEETRMLHAVIRHMDNAWMGYHQDKQKHEMGKSQAKPSPSRAVGRR